jgi:hypothetical protein
MHPGDLKFSLNQIRIDEVDTFLPSLFDPIPELHTDNFAIGGETVAVEKVEKKIYDERFLSLLFNSGKKYPYADVVFDVANLSETPNPRASNEIELNEQLLILIDCEKQIIYLSNQRMRKHVEEWLIQKTKLPITIKLLLDEEDFMEKVSSVSSVSLSADSSTFNSVQTTLAQKLSADAYGYGAERATLTLTYKRNLSERAKAAIGTFMQQKRNFKKITMTGKTSAGLESVFDTDQIVYKMPMDTQKDDITGKYNHEDAFNSLILKIRRAEMT